VHLSVTRGDGGNRTRDEGFADLCLTTWLRRLGAAAASLLAERRDDGDVSEAIRRPRGAYPPLTAPVG
jgi:hypothetical protein